jgi:hypothetical protein
MLVYRMSNDDPGKHRGRGETWGPREVLALVIIVGAFVLAGVAAVLDREGATVPAWVAVLIGGIAIYYYKNGSSSGT